MRRSGLTLIEIAVALAIGTMVALTAFAAVDATSKVIGGSRARSLEEDLVSSAVRYLQHEPAAALAVTFGGGPVDYVTTVLGVAAGYPAHWPTITLTRLVAPTDHRNGMSTALYQIQPAYADGATNPPSFIVPVTSFD